jgi:hypothetical protein
MIFEIPLFHILRGATNRYLLTLCTNCKAFGMFLGMCFGLVMHYVVCWFRIPFPGYTHGSVVANEMPSEKSALLANGVAAAELETLGQPRVPLWMFFFLAIPAIFDLGATALCMMGLRYIDVSIYQLLRGSGK